MVLAPNHARLKQNAALEHFLLPLVLFIQLLPDTLLPLALQQADEMRVS